MSETLSIQCPACGVRLRLKRDANLPLRLKVRCSSCQNVFVVRRKAPSPARIQAEVTLKEPTLGDQELPTVQMPRASTPTSSQASPSLGRVTAPRLHLSTFHSGELVADRYRVLRFVAKGGMGEIYEAEDTALKETVALKTVRPEIAANERAINRFKREILLARQVTHRNVCRIYDLGSHRSSSPLAEAYPGEEILFVSMELLRGESLADRVRRQGSLSEEAALPIIEQMCAGLDAAHAAGVVHRDFKSGNVMLQRSPEGMRVAITDFGLARGGKDDDRFSATVTAADGVLGSPAYMAPEQVEGGDVGPAADIYALGTVIYEMVTGDLPFRGENPLSTAVKRLTENPRRPTELRPDLDPKWEAVILRCLERNPANRYASGAEVLSALQGPTEEEELERATVRHTRNRILKALAAGFLLAGALALNVYVWRTRVREEPAAYFYPPEVARPAVAVLGFNNLSGKPEVDWLATALSEMLSSELAAGGKVRIVPGENVARVKLELGLPEGQALGSETLAKLRSNLGADYVVQGAYTALDADGDTKIRLDLRLQDTLAEGNATSVALAGEEGDLFELVSDVGDELREALRLEAVEGGGRGWRPANTEAARLYAEGVEQLRQLNPLGAKEILEQAVEADPRNPLVHSALASAWSSLGYSENARRETQLAYELSGSLPEEERSEIKAQQLEAAGNWAAAARIHEDLWRRYPDDLEYGLRLAAAMTAAGRCPEALEVTDVLRQLPSAAASDPRIPLAEAAASGSMGDFRRQLSTAVEARDQAEAQGAGLLLARALLLEGWAKRNLGDPEGARAATEEAGQRYESLGDEAGSAYALVQTASLLYDQGDLEGALQRFQRALETYRELGDKGNEAQALNNIALVLKQRGELDRARRLYEESVALSRETGNRVGEGHALNNIAAVLLQRGDLDGARDLFQQAIEISRGLEDRSAMAYGLYNLAVVLRKQGRLTEAEQHHEQALQLRRKMGQRIAEIASLNDLANVYFDRGLLEAARDRYRETLEVARELGNRRFEAHALFGLAQVEAAQGRLAEARRRHEEALALRRDSGERGGVAESELALAKIDLEAGRFEEAAAAAEAASAEFGRQGASDLEAWAEAVRAQAMLFLGRVTEAETTVQSALRRSSTTSQIRVRHEVELAAARVDAARERSASAWRRLDAAASAAAEAGLLGLRLEAELLLGQLLFQEGDQADGRRRLRAVLDEAREAGFGLIERKAQMLE